MFLMDVARLTQSNCDKSDRILVRVAEVGSLAGKRWRDAVEGKLQFSACAVTTPSSARALTGTYVEVKRHEQDDSRLHS